MRPKLDYYVFTRALELIAMWQAYAYSQHINEFMHHNHPNFFRLTRIAPIELLFITMNCQSKISHSFSLHLMWYLHANPFNWTMIIMSDSIKLIKYLFHHFFSLPSFALRTRVLRIFNISSQQKNYVKISTFVSIFLPADKTISSTKNLGLLHQSDTKLQQPINTMDAPLDAVRREDSWENMNDAFTTNGIIDLLKNEIKDDENIAVKSAILLRLLEVSAAICFHEVPACILTATTHTEFTKGIAQCAIIWATWSTWNLVPFRAPRAICSNNCSEKSAVQKNTSIGFHYCFNARSE